jgi:hypothetical protein
MPMRGAGSCLLVAVAGACSAPSSGTSDAAVDASTKTFPLSGLVDDSLIPVQTPIRVVVGVATPAALGQKVDCSKLVVRSDAVAPTLPASYSLDGVPEGEYILAALLIDGSGSAMAPGTTYDLLVEADGIHRGVGGPTSVIDIAIQGTLSYDCP